jgi:hypothetical protein
VSRAHVAIVRPVYADMIVRGVKVAEVRLSRTRRPPFESVRRNDVVFIRESGGGYRARARVSRAVHIELFTPRDVRAIKRSVNAAACGRPEFWRAHEHARYACVMFLRSVREVSEGPPLDRQYGRAWIVLSEDRAPAEQPS